MKTTLEPSPVRSSPAAASHEIPLANWIEMKKPTAAATDQSAMRIRVTCPPSQLTCAEEEGPDQGVSRGGEEEGAEEAAHQAARDHGEGGDLARY